MKFLPYQSCLFLFLGCTGFSQEEKDVTFYFPPAQGSYFIIPCSIGGHSVNAVLDTGASKTLLSPKLLASLRCKKLDSIGAGSISGPFKAETYQAPPIAVGMSLAVTDDVVVAMDMEIVSMAIGVPIDCFLGAATLKDKILHIDYDQGCGKISLNKSAFEAQKNKFPSTMALQYKRDCPYLKILNLSDLVLIDTGSNGNLGIPASIVSGIAGKKQAFSVSIPNLAVGANGAVQSASYWLPEIRLGPDKLASHAAVHHETGDGIANNEYAVGLEFMRNWNWLLDFTTGQVYFERSKYFGAQTWTNSSGISVLRVNDKVIVARDPAPDSPAARADIEKGDELLECEGKATSQFKQLSELRQYFTKPTGTKVKLKISHEGKVRDQEITLKATEDDSIPKEVWEQAYPKTRGLESAKP